MRVVVLSRIFTAGAFEYLQIDITSINVMRRSLRPPPLIRRVRRRPKGNTDTKRASTLIATSTSPRFVFGDLCPFPNSTARCFIPCLSNIPRAVAGKSEGGINAFYGFPPSHPLHLCDSCSHNRNERQRCACTTTGISTCVFARLALFPLSHTCSLCLWFVCSFVCIRTPFSPGLYATLSPLNLSMCLLSLPPTRWAYPHHIYSNQHNFSFAAEINKKN